MRAILFSIAVLCLAALGGCDPTGHMAKAGCSVGNCLPDEVSGYQCGSTDIQGDMWLARGAERRDAINGAQRKCVLESNAPESCFVVPNDCERLQSYCPGGEGDTSPNCRMYGSYVKGTSGPYLEF
ncbi:MAG: hypothetical protein QNJ94_09480 [Alphaproteobacteria bacterium]|nr:hypothetical protein [Alphaproteobacteria bacterium]